MPLRVTARFAQRLGTTAPIQGSGEGDASIAARCSTKCGVRETVPPAIAASYCARVFSRCTAGRRRLRLRDSAASGSQALAALGAASVDHGAAATGLHADQEAVGACAAHFGG